MTSKTCTMPKREEGEGRRGACMSTVVWPTNAPCVFGCTDGCQARSPSVGFVGNIEYPRFTRGITLTQRRCDANTTRN